LAGRASAAFTESVVFSGFTGAAGCAGPHPSRSSRKKTPWQEVRGMRHHPRFPSSYLATGTAGAEIIMLFLFSCMVSQPIFSRTNQQYRILKLMKGVEVIISMPKFSIAFIAPSKVSTLKHRIVEGQDQDSALKSFFSDEASEFYSDDDQGFFYFKEDFFDETNPSGSVVRCE
jgi:hypothetical protein